MTRKRNMYITQAQVYSTFGVKIGESRQNRAVLNRAFVYQVKMLNDRIKLS